MSVDAERSFSDSEFVQIDSCLICHSTNLEFIGTKQTIHPQSRFSVRIMRCRNCQHWHTDPMPKAELLSLLYSESSLSVLGKNWSSEIASNNRNEITVAPDSDWIVSSLSQVNPGNFLEVGPGDGSLLRKMREVGWNAFGVDLGNYACGFQVVSSIIQLPQSVLYDAIVFRDVLEHVPDPREELTNYAGMLRQGTFLFMTVPWSESKRARFGRTDWEMVRPLGHLNYFSKKSARMLLESNKFQVLTMETINTDGSSLFNQTKSLLKLVFRIIFRTLRPWKWKDLRNTASSMVIRIKCFPDTAGDQLYIMARKID